MSQQPINIKTLLKDPSWRQRLSDEFETNHLKKLEHFLNGEFYAKKTIYPAVGDIFAAFAETPFDKVKLVILGQDPYHGPGQAHGLSFSVPKTVAVPPSLKNIFKELKNDLGIDPPEHGNLKSWAQQGVLLLNATLSVEAGRAGSHQKKGWELFTDAVIQTLNQETENTVFILWGAYAQKKAHFIDRKKHFVLESVHPSPLSAHRGFFGSKPFSKINNYFLSKNIQPIDWTLN